MTIKKFKNMKVKKKAKIVLLYLLMPAIWLIYSAVKAASFLFSRCKVVLSCMLAAAMLITMLPITAFAASGLADISTALMPNKPSFLNSFYVVTNNTEYGNGDYFFDRSAEGGITSNRMTKGSLNGMGDESYGYRISLYFNSSDRFSTGNNPYVLSVQVKSNSNAAKMYLLCKDSSAKIDYGYDLANSAYTVQKSNTTEWVTLTQILKPNTTYYFLQLVAYGGEGYVDNSTTTTQWRNLTIEKIIGSAVTAKVDESCADMGAIAIPGTNAPTTDSVNLGIVPVTTTSETPLLALPKAGYQFVGWYNGDTQLSTDSVFYYTNNSTSDADTTLIARFEVDTSANQSTLYNANLQDTNAHSTGYTYAWTAVNGDWRISTGRKEGTVLTPSQNGGPSQDRGSQGTLTTPFYVDTDGYSVFLEDRLEMILTAYGDMYSSIYDDGDTAFKLDYLIDDVVVFDNTPEIHENEPATHTLRNLGTVSSGVHTLTLRWTLLNSYSTCNDSMGGTIRNIGLYHQATNTWTQQLTMDKDQYTSGETLNPSAEAQYGEVSYNYYDQSGNKLTTAPTGKGVYTVEACVSETLTYTGLTSNRVQFSIGKAATQVTISEKNPGTPKYYEYKTTTLVDNLVISSNRETPDFTTYYPTTCKFWYRAEGQTNWTYFQNTNMDGMRSKINAGTYEVKIEFEETDTHFAGESNTITLTILPIPLKVTLNRNGGTWGYQTYNGETNLKSIFYFSRESMVESITSPLEADYWPTVIADFTAASPDVGETKFTVKNIRFTYSTINYTLESLPDENQTATYSLFYSAENKIITAPRGGDYLYGQELDHGTVVAYNSVLNYYYLDVDGNLYNATRIQYTPTEVGNYWVQADALSSGTNQYGQTNITHKQSSRIFFRIVPDITITPADPIAYDRNPVVPAEDFTINVAGSEVTPTYEYAAAGVAADAEIGWSVTAPSAIGDYQIRVTVKWGDGDDDTTSKIADFSIAMVHNYVDGICTNTGDADPSYLQPNINGYYEIDSVSKLKWFMAYVNMGNTGANALLTADIFMNGTEWTTIKSFSGTFDGNAHKIQGIRNGQFITSLESGGTVKNLTFYDHRFFTTSGDCGGFVGTNSGTIEKCILDSPFVQCSGWAGFGGIAGSNTATGIIRNCAVIGGTMMLRCSASGSTNGNSMGGICGINSGEIKNCYLYNTALCNGVTHSAIVFKENEGGTISNCYYYSNLSNPVDDATAGGTELTIEQFASGEAAYLLNGGITDGTQAWYQTIGTYIYPMFNGLTVYYDETANPQYYNKKVVSVTITWGAMEFTYTDGAWNHQTHEYENGGWAENATDGNKITVKNEGTASVAVSYSYTQTNTNVAGNFTDGTTLINAPVSLPVNETKYALLTLTGKPSGNLDEVTLGTVTVTLGGD